MMALGSSHGLPQGIYSTPIKPPEPFSSPHNNAEIGQDQPVSTASPEEVVSSEPSVSVVSCLAAPRGLVSIDRIPSANAKTGDTILGNSCLVHPQRFSKMLVNPFLSASTETEVAPPCDELFSGFEGLDEGDS